MARWLSRLSSSPPDAAWARRPGGSESGRCIGLPHIVAAEPPPKQDRRSVTGMSSWPPTLVDWGKLTPRLRDAGAAWATWALGAEPLVALPAAAGAFVAVFGMGFKAYEFFNAP